jgi:hypothetical protein
VPVGGILETRRVLVLLSHSTVILNPLVIPLPGGVGGLLSESSHESKNRQITTS